MNPIKHRNSFTAVRHAAQEEIRTDLTEVAVFVLQVGQLSNRDSTFVLKDGLYKELQKDWPGYTSGDQQLLKRILVR